MTRQAFKADTPDRHDIKRPMVFSREPRAYLALTLSVAALLSPLGCQQAPPANQPAVIIDGNAGPDPAAANLAPVDPNAATPVQRAAPNRQPVRVLGAQAQYAPQQSAENYPASQQQLYPNAQSVPPPPGGYEAAYDSTYDSNVNSGYDALEEASQPPPPLPEYEQPPAPEPNTIWTPGYWNYANAGYFWVPGAWVGAPYAGALWTPGYWGNYGPNRFRFHHGFWARHIGFYGGVNYGHGYTGSGYEGGYWRGNDFFYNRAVNRVNVTNIHNVYERNVTVDNITRVSYNGGNGGVQARPRPQEFAVLHEQRTPPMATQIQVRQEASQNRQQFFTENHGRPAIPAAARPLPAEHGLQSATGQPSAGQPSTGQQQMRWQQGQPVDQRGQRTLTPEPARTQPLPNQPVQRGELGQANEQQRNAILQQQQKAAQEQTRTQESQRAAAQQQQAQQATQQRALQQQQQQQQRVAQDQQRTQQQQAEALRQQQNAAQQQQNAVRQQQEQRQQQPRPNDRFPAAQPRAVEPQQRVPPVAQHVQPAPAQPQARPQAPPAQQQHVERAQPQAQPQPQPKANEAHPR